MVSHNIEQIPKQQCQLFLVQTTLLRAVVDYESYKFYKYSCKILRYYILEGMGITVADSLFYRNYAQPLVECL